MGYIWNFLASLTISVFVVFVGVALFADPFAEPLALWLGLVGMAVVATGIPTLLSWRADRRHKPHGLALLALILLTGTAQAETTFDRRQVACNEDSRALAAYVARASGFTHDQQQEFGRGGTLNFETVTRLNTTYWLVTDRLTWQLRDAGLRGDVAACDAIRDEAVRRINAILIHQFGKVDAAISHRE